jgi:hypothetical protein
VHYVHSLQYKILLLPTPQKNMHLHCILGHSYYHRLNMKLDLQNLFGLHVHSFTHWLRPPTPRIWAHIRGRYWSAKIDDISLHRQLILVPSVANITAGFYV